MVADKGKELERKYLDVALIVEDIEESGDFSGYASVFDITDSHNDVVLKGAFSRTLMDIKSGKRDVKLLWQHHMDEPIGVLTALYEDERGLYVEGKLLLDVQRGKEAYSLLKSSAIGGLSIGYTVEAFDIDATSGSRLLRDLDLWEVSLVTFPANAQAGITGIKTKLPQTVREFEQFLREAGFSRKQSKIISTCGFELGKQSLREAGDEIYRSSNGNNESDESYIRLERALEHACHALMQ